MSVEVQEIEIPEQQLQSNNRKFPLILSPNSDAYSLREIVGWVKENKKDVEAKLLETGVLLFRGFPLTTAKDFKDFIDAFEYEHGTYLGGGGPRNVVLGPIHTSTETPPDVPIQFHHELAYLPVNPRALFFFCEIPPAKDGETPLLASYRVFDLLKQSNPTFIQNLLDKKVRYTRVLSPTDKCDRKYQRSWQEMYDTEDRGEAEKRAKETGTETVQWQEDGSMKVVTVPLDAIKFDARTQPGNTLWQPTYGDYSPIADSDVLSALDIMQKEKVEFAYKRGDVVLVDNTLALHARNTFTPPRRILTAIIK